MNYKKLILLNFFKKLRRKVCGTLPPEFLVPHFNESVVRGSSGRVHLRNGTFLPPTRAFACLDMRSASEADRVHGESHVWKNRELKKGRKGINSLCYFPVSTTKNLKDGKGFHTALHSPSRSEPTAGQRALHSSSVFTRAFYVSCRYVQATFAERFSTVWGLRCVPL